jgi:hypothetical protein
MHLPSSMPAHTSEPSAQLPCARGVDELRLALRRYVIDGGAVSDDSWRVAARLMCDDARARSIQVEELLIALKRTWAVLVDAERIPRAHSSRLLARLVTICVQEFYGPLD